MPTIKGVNSGVLISELKAKTGAVAIALVTGDGRMLGSSLPSGVYGDLFAMMCATIAGAANTVSTELRKNPPDHIVIKGKDFTTVLAQFGSGSFVVTVVGPAADLSRTVSEVDRFVGANAS